jgi:hypothetical protein
MIPAPAELVCCWACRRSAISQPFFVGRGAKNDDDFLQQILDADTPQKSAAFDIKMSAPSVLMISSKRHTFQGLAQVFA